ncbi:hypothetical protein LWI28_017649 [Acer negundo]|uniref:Uncharacterized protein n=1 Tax=Acer negundo TaxID=4023 RepID=A0AAD5NTE7_ACENE|nr:hypothetical protein LWI28_017649 [Acer negundo]
MDSGHLVVGGGFGFGGFMGAGLGHNIEDAIPEVDDDSNEVDGSNVESNYEYQPSGSVSDFDASLVDNLDERHVMSGIPGRCEPDG